MRVKEWTIIQLAGLAMGFECSGKTCPTDSDCCVDTKCGSSGECNPFPVIIIPIVSVFIVALIVVCILYLLRARRRAPADAEGGSPRHSPLIIEPRSRQALPSPALPPPPFQPRSSKHERKSRLESGLV